MEYKFIVTVSEDLTDVPEDEIMSADEVKELLHDILMFDADEGISLSVEHYQ